MVSTMKTVTLEKLMIQILLKNCGFAMPALSSLTCVMQNICFNCFYSILIVALMLLIGLRVVPKSWWNFQRNRHRPVS